MDAHNAHRKRRILCLSLLMWLLASPPAGRADGGYVPVYHPELTIFRTDGPIEIDGELNDAGWRGAATVKNFAEHNPGDQTKPGVDTEVMITYDNDNLYVAWLCYDEPGEVRASFCERDNIFSDDYVILCLDTYGEATLAYEISANPYGIPGDLLFSTANGEDITYDMVYESSGRVTDFGWVVEMAIPFASLRFPDHIDQVWRVDFWRNRPRESRYQYSWAAYDRDEDCWPCQWGTVSGISGVKPGAGFELLPAVVAQQTGALNDNNRFANDDINGDVALGIAYDISSELTAEATINPDFSQVESDAVQIDVNSVFALYYPERRPFFQEGSDLFETYFNAVHTRSIIDPQVAGKMTWRKGPNSVAFLSARDEHSVIMLPFEEGSYNIENGKSYSNILRARHDLGKQSHVGLITTDRRFDNGGSGSLVGIDGRIRFSQSDAFQFQFLTTHTEEVDNLALVSDSSFNAYRFDGEHTAGLDGETFWGRGIYAGLSRSTSNYWGGAEYWERNPTFRADNGFEPSNSVRMGSTWLGGVLRFDDSEVLENINGGIDATRKWNFDGVKKDEWINIEAQVQFRAAQTSIHSLHMRSNELFRGVLFNDIWLMHICTSTQPSGALSFGGHYNYGHRIARLGPVMGKETDYGLWADIKPIDRLLISSSFQRVFSDHVITDEDLFFQTIFWSRLSLQLSRELSVRTVFQYNNRWDKWDIWDKTDAWDFDPLLTYRINSFTVFYVGSTHDLRDLNLADHGRKGWTQTERQFFVKLQYLFQL